MTEVTIDYKVRAFGLDALDVTWAYQAMIDEYYKVKEAAMSFEFGGFDMMEFDLQAYLTASAEFDFLSAVTGNEYNPLAWWADYTADYLYDLPDAYYARQPL